MKKHQLTELFGKLTGRAGTDYPVLGKVPYTNFYCDDQPYPGFFADVETRCQAWHYCDIDGRQATFLCPNGTQFSQAVFVCDWWFNVRCELSPKLYAINSRLYGRPTESPTRPHRLITKELLENIFVRRKWSWEAEAAFSFIADATDRSHHRFVWQKGRKRLLQGFVSFTENLSGWTCIFLVDKTIVSTVLRIVGSEEKWIHRNALLLHTEMGFDFTSGQLTSIIVLQEILRTIGFL